jgi:hypothetical protein
MLFVLSPFSLHREEEKGTFCLARILSAANTPRYWASSKMEKPLRSEWAKNIFLWG